MSFLVDLPFGTTFLFARPIAADCRDATGAIVTRAADTPRFDHSEAGAARGLLITAGPAFGQHDDLSVRIGDWDASADRHTVLHEYEDDDGVQRRAFYALSVRAGVNAALRIAGRHRIIAAVPGFLPNLGGPGEAGFVRYRAAAWLLGNAVGPGDGIALGDSAGRPLIES